MGPAMKRSFLPLAAVGGFSVVAAMLACGKDESKAPVAVQPSNPAVAAIQPVAAVQSAAAAQRAKPGAPVAPVAPVTHYRTAKVEGLDVFYREAGETDAPVVVLLHGFPSS